MLNFTPNPIMFSVGVLKVHYYGFLITAAIILGFLLSVRLAKKYKIKKNKILDLYFWLIIFGLIGARLYHVFCEWTYYFAHPIDILKAYNGGLGIFGGILAGLVVIWIYSKNIATETLVTSDELLVTKLKSRANKFWLTLDILAPALILGLAIGRWGNYFNQELFGLPCNHFWCIPIELVNRPLNFISSTHFHPTFLYESLACFIIFAVILFLHKLRIRKQCNNVTIQQFNNGFIFLILITLYTAFRFLNEFLRIDQQPAFASLRLSQWVSGGLFVLAIIVLFSKSKKQNKPVPSY